VNVQTHDVHIAQEKIDRKRDRTIGTMEQKHSTGRDQKESVKSFITWKTWTSCLSTGGTGQIG